MRRLPNQNKKLPDRFEVHVSPQIIERDDASRLVKQAVNCFTRTSIRKPFKLDSPGDNIWAKPRPVHGMWIIDICYKEPIR